MEVKKFRKALFTQFMLIGIVLSASCSPSQTSPTPESNMPNPASVYCEQNGGKLELRQDASGELSVCASSPMEASVMNGLTFVKSASPEIHW